MNSRLPRLLQTTKYGFLTTLISIMFGTTVVLAQDSSDCTNLEQWFGACEYEMTEEQYNNGAAEDITQGSWQTQIKAFNTSFVGRVKVTDEEGNVVARQGGILNTVNSMNAEVFKNTDQVSGSRFVADTIDKAGIASPVNAQVPGFTTMQPGLEIWKLARNIALGFMAALGLVIAIMILLRIQSGQGYVTILSALPRIIATIILIYFSYAIGGALIDIGNVATKLIVSKGTIINSTFIRTSSGGTGFPALNFVNPGGGEAIIYPMDWSRAVEEPEGIPSNDGEMWRTMNVFRLMAGMTNFRNWGSCAPDCEIQDIIRTPTGYDIIDGVASFGDILGEVPDRLLEVILNIYLTIISMKIFFMLIKTFAELIIRTLAAPVIFLGIPISGFKVFMEWLKGVASASLVFPVTFLALFLAAYFSGQQYAPWWITTDSPVFRFAPELISHTVSDPGFIGNVLGVGVLMMIPNVKQQIEQALTVSALPTQAGADLKNVISKIPVVGAAANFLGI